MEGRIEGVGLLFGLDGGMGLREGGKWQRVWIGGWDERDWLNWVVDGIGLISLVEDSKQRAPCEDLLYIYTRT